VGSGLAEQGPEDFELRILRTNLKYHPEDAWIWIGLDRFFMRDCLERIVMISKECGCRVWIADLKEDQRRDADLFVGDDPEAEREEDETTTGESTGPQAMDLSEDPAE